MSAHFTQVLRTVQRDLQDAHDALHLAMVLVQDPSELAVLKELRDSLHNMMIHISEETER